MNSLVSYFGSKHNDIAAVFLSGSLLIASPLSVMAQDIGWAPVSMTFPSTVIGNTATQTVTLTNLDLKVPLAVNSIRWTYNEPGEVTWNPSFAFIADRSVPAELMPGESMTIDITFTAETLTFKAANLLITNTSGNIPSVNYYVTGNGVDSDLCYPLSNCSGVCVDLKNDINSCGSCYNVCDVPLNGAAVCGAGVCDFICDEGYEKVGDGCEAIIAKTPKELMDELIMFVIQSVESGALVGLGPTGHDQAGEHRLKGFIFNLEQAQTRIDTGTPEMLKAACGFLNVDQLHSDGGWPFVMPPDFVAGEAASEVNARIIEVIGAIEGCELMEAPTRPQH